MTDEQIVRLAAEGVCQIIDALAHARAPRMDRLRMKEALAAASEIELPEVTAEHESVLNALSWPRRTFKAPQSALPVRT